MLIRSDIDRVVDPVNDIPAVTGQQRGNVDVALLEILIRIKLFKSAEQLALGGLIARHLSAMKARAQSLKLMIDFAPAGFQRVGEGGIDAPQLFAQSVELAVHGVLSTSERLRRVRAQVFLNHAF